MSKRNARRRQTVDLDDPEIQAGLAERGTWTRLDDGREVHSYTPADVESVAAGETKADQVCRCEREREETAEVVRALERSGAVVEQDGGRWHVRSGPHAGTTFDTACALPVAQTPAPAPSRPRALAQVRGGGGRGRRVSHSARSSRGSPDDGGDSDDGPPPPPPARCSYAALTAAERGPEVTTRLAPAQPDWRAIAEASDRRNDEEYERLVAHKRECKVGQAAAWAELARTLEEGRR